MGLPRKYSSRVVRRQQPATKYKKVNRKKKKKAVPFSTSLIFLLMDFFPLRYFPFYTPDFCLLSILVSLRFSYLFRVGRHLGRLAVLVAPRLVDGVQVPLVEEDEEYDVITEASQAVHDGHGHDEGEQVVDERVDELVRHHSPGHVRHALELFVLVAVMAVLITGVVMVSNVVVVVVVTVRTAESTISSRKRGSGLG